MMKKNKLKAIFIGVLLLTLSTRLIAHPMPTPEDTVKILGEATQKSLPSSGRIGMLVWNLHKGMDPGLDKDYEELSADKTFILNQEFFLNDLMTEIFGNKVGYSYVMATSFFMGKERTRTGVTNASTINPVNIQYVRTMNIEPVVMSTKVTLITSYAIENSDKILTIANIHGINIVDNWTFKFELDRTIDILQAKMKKGPVIYTGDFNAWNAGKTKYLLTRMKQLGFKAAVFTPDGRMKHNEFFFDHFFHTQDINVLEAKCLDKYLGSDHKPLEVYFEIKP